MLTSYIQYTLNHFLHQHEVSWLTSCHVTFVKTRSHPWNFTLVQELLYYTFNENSYFSIPDFDLNKQCCTGKIGFRYSQYHQHIYKCNTCASSEEVCIVCAKVCHSGPGHDVVYNGYMKSWGCDCGRLDDSCKALTPRTSLPNPNNVEHEVISSSPLLPRQGKY